MKLLFVCSRNRLRSPTAEAVFSAREGIEAIGAGIDPESATPLSGDLIEWADAVLVMENGHYRRVMKKYKALLRDKKVIVLGIPDNYEYMDPELVELLERKVGAFLRIG